MIEKFTLPEPNQMEAPEVQLARKINEIIDVVNAMMGGQAGAIVGKVAPHTGPHFVTGLSVRDPACICLPNLTDQACAVHGLREATRQAANSGQAWPGAIRTKFGDGPQTFGLGDPEE